MTDIEIAQNTKMNKIADLFNLNNVNYEVC